MRALARRSGRAHRRSTATIHSPSARADPSRSSLHYPPSSRSIQTCGWEPCACADLRRPVFADPDWDSHAHSFRYVRIAMLSVCYFISLSLAASGTTSTGVGSGSTPSTASGSDNPDATKPSGARRAYVVETSWAFLFVSYAMAGWVLGH